VPVIIYGKNVKPKNAGVRKTYADIGHTVLSYLGVNPENIAGEDINLN
jgi:phosphopentomutase